MNIILSNLILTKLIESIIFLRNLTIEIKVNLTIIQQIYVFQAPYEIHYNTLNMRIEAYYRVQYYP